MSTVVGAEMTPGDARDAEAENTPAAPQSVPRILCVDDEPHILAMLERALGSQFEVVVQSDPQAALALVQHGRFSVVISDMKMPGMTGAEFLEQVKRLDPQSTRLALTGGLDWQLPPDVAFGVLTKPCPLPLLRATVSAAAQCHALLAASASSNGLEAVTRSSAGPLEEASSPLVESGLRPRRIDVGAEASTQPRPPGASPVPGRGPRRLGVALLGARVELWPRATLLGRGMDCDIVVRDERIASRHLRFFSSWRGVTVQDVSGTGGVRLNGEPLTGVRLIQPGDTLDLGPFDVCVEALET